jgi:nucleoside-diphosphate-sugar epimerase
VRIGRFGNSYGPESAWTGGREKAPTAICRKVAEARDGGTIEVWGDGSAVRSYTYIDDLIDGICALTQSDIEGPTNIASSEYVTVAELVQRVTEVAGRSVHARFVDGPVGVQARKCSTDRMGALGWRARHSLLDGLRLTYPWVEQQVRAVAGPRTAA